MSLATLTPEEKAKNALSRKFYQLIRRWHFFCGLLFIPLTLIISISGIIYLFEDEYEEYFFKDILFVEPAGERLPATRLVDIAKTSYPGMRASGFKFFTDPTRSAQITLKKGQSAPHHGTAAKPEKHQDIRMEWADDGPIKVPVVVNAERSTAYINPYTGEVLGKLTRGDTLMSFMKDLHGNLLGGKFGSYFVELTSCWVIMLMATGLVMWWPRGKVGVRGTLTLRLNESKHIFWRDLHAVPAFYFSFLIIFLVVSGLPWTQTWGGVFHSIQRDLGMNATAGFHSRTLKSRVIEGEHQHTITLDYVIAEADKKGYQGEIKVKIPRNPKDTFAILQDSDDPAKRLTMHFDQYSGKMLGDAQWDSVPLLAKAVTYGIKLHRGEFFGVWNLILALVATLVLVFMCISAIVIWLRRRPAGKFGAPKGPRSYEEPKWLLWTTFSFAVFMPLLGASLIAFFIGDWCYSKMRQVTA